MSTDLTLDSTLRDVMSALEARRRWPVDVTEAEVWSDDGRSLMSIEYFSDLFRFESKEIH